MHLSLPNMVRLMFGILIWVAVVFAVQSASKGIDESMPVNRIRHHFNPNHLRLELPIPPLDHRKEPKVGDPIKCSLDPQDPGLLTSIGEVSGVKPLGEKVGWKITIVVWEEYKHLITVDTVWSIFGGPTGFDEIVATVFDSDAQEKLEHRWALFIEENKTKLKRVISPVLNSTLNELMAVVMPNLEASFNRHQNELWSVLREHWEKDVKATLLPMLKEKASPRINSEVIPMCMDCVQELWEHAPAGSFAWNAFRDKVVPWDAKDNLKKKFVAWLDEEGKDIIDKHVPGVMAKCEEIGEELLKDAEVREALSKVARNVMNHPQLQRLVKVILQEGIMDNPQTMAFLSAKLQSPEVQNAMREFGGMIEPYVRDMIDSVLLDPRSETKKINPNLVKLMRAQILWKKDFYLVVHPGSRNPACDRYPFKASSVRYGFAQ